MNTRHLLAFIVLVCVGLCSLVQAQAAGLTTPPDKLPGIFQNADLLKQAIAGGKIATPAVP